MVSRLLTARSYNRVADPTVTVSTTTPDSWPSARLTLLTQPPQFAIADREAFLGCLRSRVYCRSGDGASRVGYAWSIARTHEATMNGA